MSPAAPARRPIADPSSGYLSASAPVCPTAQPTSSYRPGTYSLDWHGSLVYSLDGHDSIACSIAAPDSKSTRPAIMPV